MIEWLIPVLLLGYAALAWQVAKRAMACSIHSQLNADLLYTVSEAMRLLPVDAHGARVTLARCERFAEDAKAELEDKGLWRS